MVGEAVTDPGSLKAKRVTRLSNNRSYVAELTARNWDVTIVTMNDMVRMAVRRT